MGDDVAIGVESGHAVRRRSRGVVGMAGSGFSTAFSLPLSAFLGLLFVCRKLLVLATFREAWTELLLPTLDPKACRKSASSAADRRLLLLVSAGSTARKEVGLKALGLETFDRDPESKGKD